VGSRVRRCGSPVLEKLVRPAISKPTPPLAGTSRRTGHSSFALLPRAVGRDLVGPVEQLGVDAVAHEAGGRGKKIAAAHASNGLMTIYCPCGRLPARRSLVSPTVFKRSAHPSGRRSLLAETKSFIVPFGCAFFHLEYKWWTNIPPAHPPKIPRNVWCFICPAIPPNIAPWRQPIALAG